MLADIATPLPLQASGLLVVFARVGLAPREPSEPAPWVVVGPLAIGAVLAAIGVYLYPAPVQIAGQTVPSGEAVPT